MNLNQITVSVSDVARSIEFYQLLGLKLIVRSPDYARFECPDGDTTFSVHRVDKVQTGEGIWVYFEINELDQYIRLLMTKGIIPEEMPDDKSWLWREARLKDPDGNTIIPYYAGRNRKDPPWKIKT